MHLIWFALILFFSWCAMYIFQRLCMRDSMKSTKAVIAIWCVTFLNFVWCCVVGFGHALRPYYMNHPYLPWNDPWLKWLSLLGLLVLSLTSTFIYVIFLTVYRIRKRSSRQPTATLILPYDLRDSSRNHAFVRELGMHVLAIGIVALLFKLFVPVKMLASKLLHIGR